jgi:hypothetical protein
MRADGDKCALVREFSLPNFRNRVLGLLCMQDALHLGPVSWLWLQFNPAVGISQSVVK